MFRALCFDAEVKFKYFQCTHAFRLRFSSLGQTADDARLPRLLFVVLDVQEEGGGYSAPTPHAAHAPPPGGGSGRRRNYFRFWRD